MFRAIRNHVLQLLESVPDAWKRSVAVRTRSGEIERVQVGCVIQMQADHLFHHVDRIHRILRERHGAQPAHLADDCG
jgi:hypothetical protein